MARSETLDSESRRVNHGTLGALKLSLHRVAINVKSTETVDINISHLSGLMICLALHLV